MPKILSQAGNSLADVYDVEGSIAGIETLETRDLPIVHELGGTVFSERLVCIVRTLSSGALLQNVVFDVTPTDFPVTPFRVFKVIVTASLASRVSDVMVGVRSTTDALEGEIPLFSWDSVPDIASRLRIRLQAGAAANTVLLVPTLPFDPVLAVGTAQPSATNRITFRGSTLGFGAGTVTISALVYIGFALQRGLSSRGLPIPGW